LVQTGTEGKYDRIFIGTRRGQPLTTIMKVWTRLRALAGLPHLRLHDLRHQYASFLVNSGRTLYEVQQILGHSDSKVTARYSHLSTKTLQAAANSASVIINGAMKAPA
jgi:integrase